ncbi:hypothetical protein Pmar_PMAR017699 [Perkinsus marinus ATCC 50983]|uniref:Amino acid transporter n=1 Tax=Perkinsus marinus (strain ATCC 50983 / TXsc) TaxID=423536 RepID=C5L3R4_PERM5|nr:hypothetical protein Pmar_PMAR017699 [Perkinsus marinus ATCC 50983]EER08643.1 hypothetical protein Pmar_PMAR017699 [Perkinsus marinus ATCC 50983]|eukprot:XP_002776827.1 hypothetical protein Pmar_PMAR017699 [Perkinsus marinus ATCC 50983]
MVDLNGCRSGCRGVLGSNGTDENIFRRGPDPAVSCAEWGELEDWKLGTQSDWLFVGELPCLESKLYRYPLFLGIASLSFEGVGAMALPIENSMANPVKFPNVLGYAVLLILVLNLLFSSTMVIAVSNISDEVPGVITQAMPEGSLVTSA